MNALSAVKIWAPSEKATVEKTELGRVTVGKVYAFHYPTRVKLADGSETIKDIFWGYYRVIAFAELWPAMQDVVVYVGLDGQDWGRHFACTLLDFATKFSPVEERPPPALGIPVPVPEAIPEKIAGAIIHEGEKIKTVLVLP